MSIRRARGPYNRTFTSHKRAMKLSAVLLAVCCCLSAVNAQWLEKTLWLPDSFCRLDYPDCIAYNPANNAIYVGGLNDEWLVVLDASSRQRLAALYAGKWVTSIVSNPVDNKVYYPQAESNRVAVIDGATNRVADYVPTGENPDVLGYNPTSNKVYCGNYGSRDVTIFDGATNEVLATLPCASAPQAFCHNTQDNKVYVDCYDRLTVIDGVTNAKLRDIPLAWLEGHLCYSPMSNKVVAAGAESIYVIDGDRDSLIRSLPVINRPGAVCYNSVNDRVYAGGISGDVYVVDCARDSVLAVMPASGDLRSAWYNGRNNRVYFGEYNGDGVDIFDGATNQPITSIDLLRGAGGLCEGSDGGVVFCTAPNIGSVAAIDAAGDTVFDTMRVAQTHPRAICYVPEVHKMYVATEWFPGLFVTDAGADTVVRWLELGRVVRFMCSDPDRNRLWCASDSEVVAIDCASDSVVARIPAPRIATDLCLSRPAGKLYYASMPDSCVVVYDCDGDTIRAWVRLDSMPWRLAADPGSGMVYIGLYRGRSVKVMDPVGDSVITTIPVNVAGMSCLYLSTQTNKLYCFGDGGALVVVDLANDSVLRRLTIGGQAGAACLNPVAAKLYAANYENTVSIIDATRDSLLITLSGWDQPSDLVCDTVADKVYCACSGSGDIGIIDGATNRRIRTIPVGVKPNALVINQTRQRVYATNSGGSSVAVVSESAPGPGTEEGGAPVVRRPQPTVVRGVLFLGGSHKPQAASWMLDITGSKVMDLHPGPNDVRALAPGVYFVREASGVEREASSVRKIVVLRQ